MAPPLRRAHRRSAAAHATHAGDLHDHPATPGRTTGVDPVPPAAHPPTRNVTGHYVGEFSSAELNQVDRTVVGRIAIQLHTMTGRQVVRTFHVTAEMGWDNTGSTGFRGHATRVDDPASTTGVTLVGSGAGHLHLEVAHPEVMHEEDGLLIPGDDHYTFELDRRSSLPAASDATVAAEGALDRVAETSPLTTTAERAIRTLTTTVRPPLTLFFSTTSDADRMGALAVIDREVQTAFTAARLPAEQRDLMRARVRLALADHTFAINGITWTLLDWITTACARATTTAGQRAAELLDVPFAAAARAASAVHTYRFTFFGAGHDHAPFSVPVGGGHVDLGPVVGGAIGEVRVEELAGPACEHPWERYFPFAMGRLGATISASRGGTAGAIRHAVVTSSFAWQPEDFVGLIGGLEGSAGMHHAEGPDRGGPEVSSGPVMVYGSGVYDPLRLDLQDDVALGAEGVAGATITLQTGRIGGLRDDTTRAAEATTAREATVRVPAETDIMVAFDTDVSALSPAGLHALREVVAWNLGLLQSADVLVVVDAYASRRASREHNQALSERRQSTVMHALSALVPGLSSANLVGGEARGEDAAAEAGVRDSRTDPEYNAQFWRRADVSINGTLCLSLFGTVAEDEIHESDDIAGDR